MADDVVIKLTNKKLNYGGARVGAGRPTKDDVLKPSTIYLSENQRIKLDILGGAKWVRAQLDKH